MVDVTSYKFETHKGLPPDGEKGVFFGFDEAGNTYLLRWKDKRGSAAWYGCGWDPKHPEAFWGFICVEEMRAFIVAWAAAPLPWAEALAA